MKNISKKTLEYIETVSNNKNFQEQAIKADFEASSDLWEYISQVDESIHQEVYGLTFWEQEILDDADDEDVSEEYQDRIDYDAIYYHTDAIPILMEKIKAKLIAMIYKQ